MCELVSYKKYGVNKVYIPFAVTRDGLNIFNLFCTGFCFDLLLKTFLGTGLHCSDYIF